MKPVTHLLAIVGSFVLALSACDSPPSGGDEGDDDDDPPVGGSTSGDDDGRAGAGTNAGGSSGTSTGGAGAGGSAGTAASGGSGDTGGSAGAPGTGGSGGGESCPAEGCPSGTYCDLSTDRCEPGCALDEHCNANEECDLTTHECGCASGYLECEGVCVNVDTSRTDCGGCGNACADDEVCTDGACDGLPETCPAEGCPTGSYCDLASNSCRLGCALDEQCGTSAHCDLATHTCVCDVGYHDCGGVCLNNVLPDSCGSRCTPCPVPANGRALCSSGSCGVVCNSTYTLCGGLCETTPLCDKQDGVCAGALKQCPGGTAWQCPDSVYMAHAATYEVTEQTCDGRDNDCDAAVDEGMLNACGTCGPAPTETCNGLDEDCDGTPDQLPQCAVCAATPYEFTVDSPRDLVLLNDEAYVVTGDTAMRFANLQPQWTADLTPGTLNLRLNTSPMVLAQNGGIHIAAGRQWAIVSGTTTIINNVTAYATLDLQTGFPTWIQVDPLNGTEALAFAGTGNTLAVVYSDSSGGMTRARLATRVGTAPFTLVGPTTVGVLDWVGAAYDASGALHVAYSSIASTINYRHNVLHRVWGGTTSAQAFANIGYIYDLKLVPGPNGSIHTAFTYYDGGFTGPPHAQYLRFDGGALAPAVSQELPWLGGTLGFDNSGQTLMIHGVGTSLVLSRRPASGTWDGQPLLTTTGHSFGGIAVRVDSFGRHHILYRDTDAADADRYYYDVACPNWD